jgi:hypothetical protein
LSGEVLSGQFVKVGFDVIEDKNSYWVFSPDNEDKDNDEDMSDAIYNKEK